MIVEAGKYQDPHKRTLHQPLILASSEKQIFQLEIDVASQPAIASSL